MEDPIRQLKPQAVWNNFAELNAIPRPSKKEDQVQAFVMAFAEKLGLEHQKDAAGNIVVRKPASSGMEERRPVILQAHLDMVCQKNADVDFDFDQEGIRMQVQGDWVTAEGTTLGADNGIGAASIMAILASEDIPHPPLEALFTADEEAGMTGAHNLQPGFLQGEILLNLDTEDDDELSIGCAGGIDTNISWNYREETLPREGGVAYHLKVRGLYGGHSGMDIIYGRGNANKILNRLLWDLAQCFEATVSSIHGGGLRNAIPREAEAIVVVPSQNAAELEGLWKEQRDLLRQEFATTDPHLDIQWPAVDTPKKGMKREDFRRLTLAIQATHDGIRRLSPDVEDLVETSNNLASIEAVEGKFRAKMLTRSDRESGKYDMAHAVAAPYHLLDAEVQHSGTYPGWKLDPEAPMLQMMHQLYRKLFQQEPKVIACHAGLECGLLGQNYPHLEMISFGPTIENPHSPDERVSISSVQKFWHYLQNALQEIPAKSEK